VTEDEQRAALFQLLANQKVMEKQVEQLVQTVEKMRTEMQDLKFQAARWRTIVSVFMGIGAFLGAAIAVIDRVLGWVR